MNNAELAGLFMWSEDNLMKFEVHHVDESEHYYFENEMVGGFAGDTGSYFYTQSAEATKLVGLFDAGRQL